jgi:hypothetical protein
MDHRARINHVRFMSRVPCEPRSIIFVISSELICSTAQYLAKLYVPNHDTQWLACMQHLADFCVDELACGNWWRVGSAGRMSCLRL